MKKCNLKSFVLIMALGISAVLSGCAAHAAAAQEPNSSTANGSLPMEQAYESDEVISPEEQAKNEETRRGEIAEQYSIYEPYGMTYDKEKDRFFYKGQMVRYFKDQVSTENTNSFFFEDGVVDVEPIRDTNGTLTGVKQSSNADFNARTKKQKGLKAEFDVAGMIGNTGSFELGDPNDRDDSLDAYTVLGVSYDQSTQKWVYDGKIIHILYDADYNTYYDNSASDGINLKAIRDKNGNIEKLVETAAQEVEQYVK